MGKMCIEHFFHVNEIVVIIGKFRSVVSISIVYNIFFVGNR